MHRHYKIETYYEQIRRWRDHCPSGGLSTDIIVGFPTETDADFELTMKLLEDLRFDQVFSFAYSSRPGTKAAKLPDDVPTAVKKARLLRFQKRAVEIAKENNQKYVGHEVEVLVEGPIKALKSLKIKKCLREDLLVDGW
jgi:tRNA-2-methylthio-N6-dimethylallyladenosine synthase